MIHEAHYNHEAEVSYNLYFEIPHRMQLRHSRQLHRETFFKLSWLSGCLGSECSRRRLSVRGSSRLKQDGFYTSGGKYTVLVCCPHFTSVEFNF